jgi:UDP-N-acetyl-D-mannosaminuronic acid dehydrogenase
MQSKIVSVIGLGYIGLPTAALLARNGFKVAGIDLNAHVVATINSGDIHIVEPDLYEFVSSAVSSGNLKAYTTPQPADTYMICVPTPFHEGKDVPQPNIDYIVTATLSISSLLKSGDMVILESTSPVGTTRKIAEILEKSGVDIENINFAYCPERVLPGKIMKELVENDRVVGGLTPKATKAVSLFYKSFVKGTILETDTLTAEMCKLTENSFRDVNIAFANELSLICEKEGINVWDLIKLANHHPRVNILQPGAGVGGHCIAVDPWFIVARNPEHAKLIRTAREVNNFKTQWVIDQIKIAVADLSMKLQRKAKIACLGLAFKPNIDDLRESPACMVVEALQDQGFNVVAVEPNIAMHYKFQLVELKNALETSDLLVFLVKHTQFLEVSEKLTKAKIMDFCGLQA